MSSGPTRDVLDAVLVGLAMLDDGLDGLDCAICGVPTPFERVECGDGHGDGCPDRVCTGCGAVVVIGPAPLRATA